MNARVPQDREPAASTDAPAEGVRSTRSTCPYCGVGCGVLIDTAGEGDATRVVGVRGDPDHPANFGRLCSKGSSLHLTGDLDARALYPELRLGKALARSRSDWDSALDHAASVFAETIREREYLERQVLTLSAEGRLSVWILGGLPPGFMAYLAVANPKYLRPMYTNPLGWVMLVVMACLLTAGIFWMRKLVKVEV